MTTATPMSSANPTPIIVAAGRAAFSRACCTRAGHDLRPLALGRADVISLQNLQHIGSRHPGNRRSVVWIRARVTAGKIKCLKKAVAPGLTAHSPGRGKGEPTLSGLAAWPRCHGILELTGKVFKKVEVPRGQVVDALARLLPAFQPPEINGAPRTTPLSARVVSSLADRQRYRSVTWFVLGSRLRQRVAYRVYGCSGEMAKNEPAPHGPITVRTLVMRDRFYAVYPQVSYGFFDRLQGHEAGSTLGSA